MRNSVSLPSSNKRPSVAVLCFIPDFGHLQPLLKIADALRDANVDVRCYIASECVPLLGRFRFDCFALDDTSQFKKEKEMTRVFSRSTFFNSVCLYVQYLLTYPRVGSGVARFATELRDQLNQQRPDLIVSDTLWFEDCYKRIAQSLGLQLVMSSLDGSLAYNQRPFVRVYGLDTTSSLVQTAVEKISALSRILCSCFYRLRYFSDWLHLLSVRKNVEASFEAAFPVPVERELTPKLIATGTARIERERLSNELNLAGADRPEFPALKFRSSIDIPDGLRSWIESENLGPLVYVSFGSAVDLDADFATAVYEGLRSVQARIIWSLPVRQRSFLSKIPTAANVRLETFVPQPEILGLSQVKCFVTQGGPHSVQEALFGGTPMLCIPFFADQAYNSSVVEKLGVGQRLWRRDVTAKSVSIAINEILSNQKYSKAAVEIGDHMEKNEGGAVIAQYILGLIHSTSPRRVQ